MSSSLTSASWLLVFLHMPTDHEIHLLAGGSRDDFGIFFIGALFFAPQLVHYRENIGSSHAFSIFISLVHFSYEL